MKTGSRKEQEILRREEQILELARPILLREGLAGLSMDRLAVQMQYAKGTLYNHFPNKEEIVLALALRALETRVGLFERASLLQLGSRERITAIGCAAEGYAEHHRDQFAMEQLIRNTTIWEKCSEQRQELVRRYEQRCMSIVAGVVRGAIAAGDLVLPGEASPEDLVFGLWALTYGSHVLVATSPSLPDLGIRDPARAIRFHCWLLLNGFGWRPLQTFAEQDACFARLGPLVLGSERK